MEADEEKLKLESDSEHFLRLMLAELRFTNQMLKFMITEMKKRDKDGNP